MIKNFVVTGCSFTQSLGWAQEVVETVKQNYCHSLNYTNLATSGAGNFYIADSLAYFLTKNNLDPAETLVMVMWSGVSRKDITVSDDFYSMVNSPASSAKQDLVHYVISGGQIGSWQSEVMFPRSSSFKWFLRPIFENLYKSSDEASMAHDTLSAMIRTKDFLEHRGYHYKFMSYVNYWGTSPGHISNNLDFNIPACVPDHPFLNALGDQWIWADDNKNCVYEYAKELNLLEPSDGFHPTKEAYKRFTKEFIMPNIQGLFL